MKAKRVRSAETSRSCATARVSNAIRAVRRAAAAKPETCFSPCIPSPSLHWKRPRIYRARLHGVRRSAIAAHATKMKSIRLTRRRRMISHSQIRIVVTARRLRRIQKLFDIAARCSMRNITIGKIRSANCSPNARFENLIDEPCVKTYEGKCVNNAELFLRTRIARVIECDACGATSGCS